MTDANRIAVRVLAGLLIGAPIAAASPRAHEVRFESGRLWITTEGAVPVGELARAVTEATGVEFEIGPALARGRIRVELRGTELERALRLLAEGIPGAGGFVMSHLRGRSEGSRITRVTVLAEGAALPPPPADPAGQTETVVFRADFPDERSPRAQKAAMVRSGLPLETAELYIDLLEEAREIERSGAAPSERFLERRDRLQRQMTEARRRTLEIDAARERGHLPP